MSEQNASGATSTRRAFLKNGTMLAAPLAAVAAPAAAMADDEWKNRLALLENQAAIRDLHQSWLRTIHNGAAQSASPEAAGFDPAIRSISTDHAGGPDVIEVGSDGRSAIGWFHCTVEIEIEIAQDCTLARMAHEQGGGFIRRTERRLLKADYVKTSGGWSIAKIDLQEPPDGEIR